MGWSDAYDATQAFPVFPVDLFAHALFSLSVFTAFLAFVTQGLVLVVLPYILFQQGIAESQIGFLIAPWPIMGALMAPMAGMLSNKISAALLGAIGLGLLGTSVAVMAYSQVHLSAPILMLCMFMCGLGFGLFLTPNQRMLMAGSPMNRSGAAGGMLNVARTLGQAVGAVLVAFGIKLFTMHPALVLWIGAGFAWVAAGVSLLRFKKYS